MNNIGAPPSPYKPGHFAWLLMFGSAGGIQLILLAFYPGFPWIRSGSVGSPGPGYGAAYGAAIGGIIVAFVVILAITIMTLIALAAFLFLVRYRETRRNCTIVFLALSILTCANGLTLWISRVSAWERRNSVNWEQLHQLEREAERLERQPTITAKKKARELRDTIERMRGGF